MYALQTTRALRALPRTVTSPVRPAVLASSSRIFYLQTGTISSSAASVPAPLQEWFVICPDFDGALEKRVKVRPEHLKRLEQDREDFWLWGGPMLEEPIQQGGSVLPKMKGSAMLIGARTREEVVERLKNDIYVSEGVWDFDKAQIFPFKSTLRKAL